MRHANHDFLNARDPAVLDEVIEQGDECIRTFKREALLPDVFRVQIALEPLGHRQLPQKVAPLGDAEIVADAARLELILQPQTFLRIRDVREFGADGARIDVLELGKNVAQLKALGIAAVRLPVKNSQSRSLSPRPK